MVNKISPIQIIGTQRSGSNLLRLILNQFDEIIAPHPPHVLRTFSPLLKYYGELSIADNFHSLGQDVAEFVNANPVPWDRALVDYKELVNRARNNTLLSLYEMLYVIRAEHENANIWCCKSMFNEYYVEDIEAEGIKPFYIYIYRDGRDVAASFKKSIIGPKHIYHIAHKWQQDQEKAKEVFEFVGPERFFSLKYEELITEPEKILRSLSVKLGLSYSTSLLDFYKSPESKITAESGEMWKNVSKPIIENNIGKFKLDLDSGELKMFENIAGKYLLQLGYALEAEDKPKVLQFSREEINVFDQINEAQKLKARNQASEHDLKIRSKQEDVLNNIKVRFNLME